MFVFPRSLWPMSGRSWPLSGSLPIEISYDHCRLRNHWGTAMTHVRKLAAAALLLTVGTATLVWAAGKGDPGREAQDRAEIEGLMWHYVRALDTHDADAYAKVYTEDGVFQSGTNITKG